MRSGRATSFADANANPGKSKLREVLGNPAYRGHGGPHREAYRNQPNPVGLCIIRIAGDWYAEHGIKHGESRASQQTELCIAQPKLALDRFGQNIDNLAIQKVQNVHEQKREQHYLGIGDRQPTAAHSRSIMHSVSPSPMRSYSTIFRIVKHQQHNDFDNRLSQHRKGCGKSGSLKNA